MARNQRIAQVHVFSVLAALGAVFGLAAVLSAPGDSLRSVVHGHDAQLVHLSHRAEQLQAFSRNIRKASLVNEAQSELPFAGYVDSFKAVEVGTRLKLAGPNLPAHTIEIVSARKLSPSLGLAEVRSGKVSLMVITGQFPGLVHVPAIRFLMAVGADKIDNPATTADPLDHQTL